MGITLQIDPTTGRKKYVDDTTFVEVAPADFAGLGGGQFQQTLLDQIEDRNTTIQLAAQVTTLETIHENAIVWEEGVADFDGSTGTDNGDSLDDIITEAISLGSHTQILIPPGRYYAGSTYREYALTSEITIQGIGDVEIAGDASTSILGFVGATAGAGFGTVVTLDGDHNRTSRVMGDGQTYYDGVETFTFNEDHNANVGDYFMMYDNTQAPWATGAGAPIYHISIIEAVPSDKSIVVSAPSFFNFLGGETGYICPFWGPLHLKNIKFNNFKSTGSNSCVRTYRINHGSVEDCHFTGTNPDGTSDHFLISDSQDWRFERCKWEHARYGILCNRTFHVNARDNEVNDTRHFIAPGYTSAHGMVENAWGRDNTSIVDGHLSINWTWKNIYDIGGYSGAGKNDMFNCRSLGFTLDNVYWEGWADGVGNKNVYLGCHVSYNTDYEDLLWRFPTTIRNVSFHTRTAANVNLRRAGTVTIQGLSLGGGGYVELGNSDEGIVALHGTDTIIGSSNISLLNIGGADPDYERFSGTLVSGGSGTTAVLPTGTTESSSFEDFHEGSVIQTVGGLGAGQTRRITAYTVVGGGGSDREITVDAAWSPATDATTQYEINCTNIRCDQNSVGHNWGIARKKITDQTIDGPDDSKAWRVRVWPIVEGDEESARFESILVTLQATTHAGATPGYGKWVYLFDYKSIPTRGNPALTLMDEVPNRAGRDMTLAISDLRYDPDQGSAGPAWFEFTITTTTEETAIAIFCTAETIGAN